MRCTSLTVLFFALFALFSTMAYAAPVAPQGAILQRRCTGDPLQCRDATPPPAGSNSPDRFTTMANLLTKLFALMGSDDKNTPKNDLAQPTTTIVTAVPSSSVAPASDPTGV